MTLRLTEEQERVLRLLAEAEGVSKHEAIVRAISDAAARQLKSERIRAFSRAGQVRYASLLERLAQ